MDLSSKEKELGSDHRISVHVNTPCDRIQWNAIGAAEQKVSNEPDYTFRELVPTSLSRL